MEPSSQHLPRSLKFFLFKFLRTLLHFFALTENSTRFFSSASALFVKNTGGGGGAGPMLRRSNPGKQISLLPVLTVERGWRYGWKLPTGLTRRLAYAEEKPRLYLRRGSVAGAGHRGEYRYLYHYQRRLSPPAARRGTFASRGTVHSRHQDRKYQRQLPAHRHFAPQLRRLSRPEHSFHRLGDRHLPHSPELEWAGRAATIERHARQRQFLRRPGREALSRAHLYRRWRQETGRESGSGSELQLMGPPIRLRRQVHRPDHRAQWHALHCRRHRATEFQRNRVARPARRPLDPDHHARLCSCRPAQGPRKQSPLPLAPDRWPVESQCHRRGSTGGDENSRSGTRERISRRQHGPHRLTLYFERIGAGDQR